jgi:poly-gamma-glutamate capsule biosynthesis protein CapA/YwtB (metallophosphatase superfamily)
MGTSGALTICGVGDVGPIRPDPDFLFELSAPVLRSADIAFCQLERILTERTDPALTASVALHPARVATSLRTAGFDAVSFAGNHHMDAGPEGFMDTLDLLRKNGMRPVGVGSNITEARSPAIFELNGTKVAFLGYSSIIPRSETPYEATAKRPGCAPMYVSTFYEAVDWQPGAPPKVITITRRADLLAMQEDVKRAKEQADVVIMSIHWGIHHTPAVLAMYEHEVGHAAIDAGVDLILGHSSHILKGIQVYKGKVIFHCLGNFAIDRPRKTKHGVEGGWEGLNPREFEPGWEEYPFPAEWRKSMIAKAVIVDRRIQKVSFQPCMINRFAQPEPLSASDDRFRDVEEYVAWCNRDQGIDTKFSSDGDEVVVNT